MEKNMVVISNKKREGQKTFPFHSENTEELETWVLSQDVFSN
jgi:hypothetical protein